MNHTRRDMPLPQLMNDLSSSPKSLKQLLAAWQTAVSHTHHPQPPNYDGPDVQISHLTEKTSEVTPGAGFVARVRVGSDGHPYIGQALAAGASLVLSQRRADELGLTVPAEVAYVVVPDTAETLAWLAAAWEDFPARHLVIVGVTGTDGKTTTSNLLYEILQTAGIQTGLLSTIKAVIGNAEEPLELHVTTPEAPVVQRYLRRMVQAGLTHCVLEVTSHALAQHRVTAVPFDISVVTNITHEHLDYHGSYADYFAAKTRLFTALQAEPLELGQAEPKSRVVKTAVLNRDDGSFAGLSVIPVARQISYGVQETAESATITATHLQYAADKTHFHLNLGQNRSIPIQSALVGEFNVSNMLAAAAAATALGIEPAVIRAGLEAVPGVSGRMERISQGQPFLVIVDFAHTPNALLKAIAAARRMTNGRIITVFGSAGKRDKEKRRMMAEYAAQYADLTILTAEDPRTESLDDILAMMADGCRRQGGREGQTFWRIPDRGQAIYHALTLAQPADLLLICGKGHEQSMCFVTTEYPWDDRTATRAALEAFLQHKPMPNLGLPTFTPQT